MSDVAKLDPKTTTLLLTSRDGRKWMVAPKSIQTATAKLIRLTEDGVLGSRDYYFVYAGDDQRDGKWFRLYIEVECFCVKVDYDETAQRAE